MRRFLQLAVALLVLTAPAVAQAARTPINSKTPSRTGITWSWTAPDTVNGNSCQWGSITMLMAQNTTASTVTITIWAASVDDGDLTQPNRVVSLPANQQGAILVSQYFQQGDGTVWVDAPTGVNLACFTKS